MYSFKRKLTTQSILAFILVVFGMALVILALFMPPRGEIHPSVITVLGMLLVTAGAFLGIDLNFQFKSYLNAIRTYNPQTTQKSESQNPNPDLNPNTSDLSPEHSSKTHKLINP